MTDKQVQQEFQVVSRLQAGFYFDPPVAPDPIDWDALVRKRQTRTVQRTTTIIDAVSWTDWRSRALILARMQTPLSEHKMLEALQALLHAKQIVRQRNDRGVWTYRRVA